MTKAKISEYDAVAANNTDVNGVNIAENCPPSGMNNMGREIMAALKRFQVGSDGDGVTVGGNLVVSGSSTLSTTSISSADINAGTIDATAIGGSTAAAGSFTTLNTSGAVVFNDAGADVDFRVEGDTNANLLFVDASADAIGIGTNTPNERLVVNGAIRSTNNQVGATATPDSGLFYYVPTADAPSDPQTTLQAVGTVSVGASITFKTGTSASNSERARIDSSGNLLVGTTSGSSLLSVGTAANALQAFEFSSGTNKVGRMVRNASSTTDVIVDFLNGVAGGTVVMEVRANGGIANFSANDVNLSDRREKTNFAPAKNYLDTICAIPVQTFNYIDQSEDDPSLTLGVVAQDVQEVAPELVMESDWSAEKDGSKMRLSIYQTDFQYALMKCIQELKAELDTVKAELATLKG